MSGSTYKTRRTFSWLSSRSAGSCAGGGHQCCRRRSQRWGAPSKASSTGSQPRSAWTWELRSRTSGLRWSGRTSPKCYQSGAQEARRNVDWEAFDPSEARTTFCRLTPPIQATSRSNLSRLSKFSDDFRVNRWPSTTKASPWPSQRLLEHKKRSASRTSRWWGRSMATWGLCRRFHRAVTTRTFLFLRMVTILRWCYGMLDKESPEKANPLSFNQEEAKRLNSPPKRRARVLRQT